MDNTFDNKNCDLFLRCIQGKATDEEYAKAWDCINNSAEDLTCYNELKQVWFNTSRITVNRSKLLISWNRVGKLTSGAPEEPVKSYYFLKSGSKISLLLKVAAAILLTVCLQILANVLYNHSGSNSSGIITVEAPKGAKTFLTLDDGSKIWLNAGSKLQYSKSFNTSDRKVKLEGEAFFQVSKNKDLPFKVLAQGIEVRALGTSFNVNAYPDDGFVQTTLVEGSVEITSKKKFQKEEKIVLMPNQSVIFYIGDAISEKQPADLASDNEYPKSIRKIDIKKKVDVYRYISWKEKRWVFEGESIENLATKLERRYDVIIRILDEELKEYKISGILEDETIEQVLSAVKLTVPMDFRIDGNIVELKLNKSLETEYYDSINDKN